MTQTNRISTPLGQRLAEFRTGPLAGLLWGLGALVCALMMSSSGESFGLLGIAHVEEVQITAPLDGEVAEVLAGLYDEVRAGDVIALMDASEVEGQLATAGAEVERMRAELAAASVRLADEREVELRRFRNDEQDLNLDALALSVELERDRLERDRLRAQLERVDQLASEGLTPQLERDDLANRVLVLEGTIARSEALLEATEGAVAEARVRRTAFENAHTEFSSSDSYLDPLREAVEVQRLRLGEVGVLRERLVLRAPITGRIRALLVGPGQALQRGDPVALVADPMAARVVAYLPEASAGQIGLGTRLLVSRVADPRTIAESFVTEIGPTVERMPERLWRDPAVPEYGVPVLARAPLTLLPGEPVRVHATGEPPSTHGAEILAAAN